MKTLYSLIPKLLVFAVFMGHAAFAQNVGIGTMAPATQLHIDGNTSQHTAVMLENEDIQAGVELETQSVTALGEAIFNMGIATNRAILEKGADPTGAWIRMDTRSSVRRFQWFWEEQGTNTEALLMTLQHNGNLGIGTNSPARKLHVAGGNAYVGGTSWSSTGDVAHLILGDGNHGIRANWGEGVTVFTSGAGDGIKLEQSTGNVGIGTADPTSKLDVLDANQALTLRAGNSVNNYGKNQIMMGFNGTAQYRHAVKSRHNGGSGAQNAMDFYLWDQSTDDVNDVGTLHTMSLNNGDVGIGIQNPVGKLDVQSDGGFFLQDVTSASAPMPASFPFNSLDMAQDHRVRFTASESGPLQYIQIRVENGPGATPPNTITLELYNGDVPTGGTPIATSNPIYVSNNFFINHNFIFPSEPNITAGNTYTFRIVGTSTRSVWLTHPGNANHYYENGVLQGYASVGHLVAVEQPLDNRLVFNSGGLGINVLSPNEALDVNGQIRMRTGATNGYIPVADANGVMTWTDPATITTAAPANDGDWTISGSNLFSAVSGNVGIGQTAPTSKLHIDGGATQHTAFQIENDDVVGGIELESQSATAAGEGIMNIGLSTGFGITQKNTPADVGFLRIDTRSGERRFGFHWNGTETTSILANGNVGMGTSTPDSRLDVEGDVRVNDNPIHLRAGTDVNHGVRWDNGFGAVTGIDGAILYGFSQGVLGTTQGGERAILNWDLGGFVGVNVPTAAPAAGLEVRTRLAADPSMKIADENDAAHTWFNFTNGDNYITGNTDRGSGATVIRSFAAGTYTEHARFTSNGNVGIGTNTPTARLDVRGELAMNDNILRVRDGADTRNGLAYTTTFGTATSLDGPVLFGNTTGALGTNNGGNATIIYWNDNRRVGINTSNPQATLEVQGSVSSTQTYSFLNGGGTGGPGTFTQDYSIHASNAILASEFNAFSDIRIKNIERRLDKASALDQVMALQPTHYSYIDSIVEGTKQKTGFIAQEVKAVVPEAVTATQKRFIPNVYTLAKDVSFDDAAQTLTVTLPKAHDLSAGDSVRFITETGEATALVAQVGENNSVVFEGYAGETPADALTSVFVFGKWVTDFHTVDYDHLYTLGIGAIQALQQQVAEMKAHQTADRQTNSELEARVERLEELMGQQSER